MLNTGNQVSRNERRHAKRVTARFIVTCKLERISENMPVWSVGGEVDALMVDLSERGMGIVTKHDIPKATNFLMSFTLINLYAEDDSRIRSISAKGAVCHNTLLNKVERRLGICFTEINKEDKLAIADFVRMQANQ